jgi:hypothetical protein
VIDKPLIRDALSALVKQLSTDADLDDADLARIHDAAVDQARVIQAEKAWAQTAHLHDVSHAPIVTVDADGAEDVDASPHVCHDCRRQLVADVLDERTLVCPKLHGRCPRDLVPGKDAAVECGQPDA